jgi:nicotinate-nucleotide pyrophosphorylase
LGNGIQKSETPTGRLAFPGSWERLGRSGKILIGKKEIALAGGITAALDEAHSAASIRMKPRAITAYEAVGSAPTEEEGAGLMVQIVVQDEEELREAIGAGAEAVLLEGVSAEEARRLGEIARGLRGDCVVEVSAEGERE